MSLLRDFLHTVFGGNKYPTNEHLLSSDEIRRLVSQSRVASLSQVEVQVIQETIVARRRGDGKISLSQIDEALGVLQQSGKISQYDRQGVMREFQRYVGMR